MAREESGKARPWRLEPVDFTELAGWAEDDHSAAFAAFRQSSLHIIEKPPRTRQMGLAGEAVVNAARGALALGGAPGRQRARAFFEATFQPMQVRPETGDGFFTGYYEPEVDGARERSTRFSVPLYARPDDLINVDDSNRPKHLGEDIRFARQIGGRIEAYPDRAAIETGFLAGKGLELVWLEDPVDAFFIHIQGSARVRLRDGAVMRLGFAGKSGHAYTSIGKVMLAEGALEPGKVTMETIRAWFAAHPDQAPRIMRRNRSFIFFHEAKTPNPELGPIAAGGVQLTPGRSLAVDRELHTFHAPVWVETKVPDAKGSQPFRRLLVAQDTGSAIVGPARGDIFFGSGNTAAALAGPMQSSGRFVLLVPRETVSALR